MLNPEDEARIIIWARVTDIPGDPYRRHTTLGELFSANFPFRPFNLQITPDGYDGVILPPYFWSEKPVNKWFIYDLNVKGTKSKEELAATPHKVFLASKQEDKW
jgi:hypothetical protein